jgi:hypothetical protein
MTQLRYEPHQGGRRNAFLLTYPPEWEAANLPPPYAGDRDAEALRVVLLDTETGLTHGTAMGSFPEDADTNAEGVVFVRMLQGYMYADHFCTCHRAASLESCGVEHDGGCEGNRFRVVAVTPHGRPGLVLYSETLGLEELEGMLEKETAV